MILLGILQITDFILRGLHTKKGRKVKHFYKSVLQNTENWGEGRDISTKIPSIYSGYSPCDKITHLKTGRFTVSNPEHSSQNIHLGAQGRSTRL